MKGPVDLRIARRLGELRRHAKLSQAELATAIGVSQNTISGYEKGAFHIPADRLPDLARAMSCTVHDMMMTPGSPLPRLTFQPKRRRLPDAHASPRPDIFAPLFHSIFKPIFGPLPSSARVVCEGASELAYTLNWDAYLDRALSHDT